METLGLEALTILARDAEYQDKQELVAVDWAVPNNIESLITYIGGGDQMNLAGTALSSFF